MNVHSQASNQVTNQPSQVVVENPLGEGEEPIDVVESLRRGEGSQDSQSPTGDDTQGVLLLLNR